MLLSRFWYIFLAVLASAAASAALLSLGVLNRQALEHAGDELRRDRTELDAILRLEARARLDRIAFISVDNKIGSVLKQAASISDRSQLTKVGSEGKDALRAHVQRLLEASSGDTKAEDLKPDIAMAVDINGRIIAELGPLESNPPGASVATYPFIDRALHGYLRDDIVVYDRRVYRVAARPVLFGGEYVGAIAHGYKFDDAFSSRVAQGLGGATVLFFYGRTTLASSVPNNAPPLAEVASKLPEVLTDEHFKRGERTEPVALHSGGRALYSLVVGGAARAEVGYSVARPVTFIASPLTFFQNASREDVDALPLTWIGLGAFLLALIGIGFVYLERDRPFVLLRRKLQQVQAAERERLLITEWRGAYRKLADAINQTLEKVVERAAEMAPAGKKKANLDEILGPTPQSNVEPYFGFADASAPTPSKAKAATPARVEAPAAKPAPATNPGATANALPAPGTAAARAKPAAAPVTAAAPAASANANAGQANGPSSPDKSLPRMSVTEMVSQKPAEPPAGSPPLLQGNDNAGEAPDEARHFRDVYAQYLNVRKDCGEPTDGLSYEKFELTLTKTRDQVLTKHAAKGVRFTVYVKEGKAALKAAPVKR